MAKQTEFEHPPGRHVGLLAHDDVADKWYAVSSDADGHLQVDLLTSALPSGAATSARQDTMITALQLIDDLRAALGSVDTDDLQVDVKTSALPTDAATATNQATLLTEVGQKLETADLSINPVTKALDVGVAASVLPSGAATSARQDTMITALQLIDNLANALTAIASDQLRVDVIAELPAGTQNIGDVDVLTMPTTTVQAAGGDKIFSFESVVLQLKMNLNADAGTNILDTDPVPTGKVWVITAISIYNDVSNTAVITINILSGGLNAVFKRWPTSTAAVGQTWSGHVYLQAGDFLRAGLFECVAGDDIYLIANGYQMDAP